MTMVRECCHYGKRSVEISHGVTAAILGPGLLGQDQRGGLQVFPGYGMQ